MTAALADALTAVAGMMDRLQQQPLAENVRADAVRDLGCLKLQLMRSSRRPAALAALCGQLREIDALSDLVDRVELAVEEER
jgi:hypothetical protein